MREAFRYRVLVERSDPDQVYVARVPALPDCMAHGPTADKAAHEAQRAAAIMLDILKEDGTPAPPADTSADLSGQLR